MTRWYQEKKKEHFYKEAKRSGYRARSAYKLKQINSRFKIFSKNDNVVDLGAAPGSWLQVVKELVGDNSILIGVDLLPIAPINNVECIQGDITDKHIGQKIEKKLNGNKADVVISDISPDITGNYSIDQARSLWLCEQAFDVACKILKPGGIFVFKIFEGSDSVNFLNMVKKSFNSVKKFSPSASRKRSSEIYIIAKSLKNNSP
jgi:23S rRNA (uridine2552-2'-O)-methyltransferase